MHILNYADNQMWGYWYNFILAATYLTGVFGLGIALF